MSKENTQRHSEFDDVFFAKEYRAIADTFIDTKGAAESFMNLVPTTNTIFELGLGTGYFASHLYFAGYDITGIEPPGKMLPVLKADYPNLPIKAELPLEEFQFDEKYDVIVSHSSIFLITTPSDPKAQLNDDNLIFQSFIKDGKTNAQNLKKVLDALSDNGKLMINVQTNAKPDAPFGPGKSFQMLDCVYDFPNNKVSKTFAITVDGFQKVLDPDISYVLVWDKFKKQLADFGYSAIVTNDRKWVVISKI